MKITFSSFPNAEDFFFGSVCSEVEGVIGKSEQTLGRDRVNLFGHNSIGFASTADLSKEASAQCSQEEGELK